MNTKTKTHGTHKVQMYHPGGQGLAPAWCDVGKLLSEGEAQANMALRIAHDTASGFRGYKYRVVPTKTGWKV